MKDKNVLKKSKTNKQNPVFTKSEQPPKRAELHQNAEGNHLALTTNQGVKISDN